MTSRHLIKAWRKSSSDTAKRAPSQHFIDADDNEFSALSHSHTYRVEKNTAPRQYAKEQSYL